MQGTQDRETHRTPSPRDDDAARAHGPIRVLVVDDNRTFGESVASYLRRFEEVRFVGQAFDEAEATTLLERLQPDVVLLDLHIPGVNTQALARLLRAGVPAPVVVLVTGHGPEVLRAALAECAVEYGLTKDDVSDRLGPLLVEIARRLAGTSRRSSDELHRLHHLRTTALLASGLVHDLNNPLTCLHIETDICRKTLEQAIARLSVLSSETAAQVAEALAGCRKNLDGVAASLKQVSGLTREFATLTRGTDPRQRLSLRQVAEQAIRVTLPRTRLRAQTQLEGAADMEVLGQSFALTSVVINLLVNAADAFDRPAPDNRIRVVLGAGEEEGAPVGSLDVIDTGPGIPDPIRARLFQPFVTSKPASQGGGLGLCTSRAVMEDMGGRLELLRTGRDGSAFRVTLPRARD